MSARILVVEDNAINMELVRDILESRGYEVLEAVTAAEALRIASEETLDLILMDIQLPEMDGLEATRRLRVDSRTAAVPIVALTAHAMPGESDRALEAGCNGFITKPIDLRAFASSVASFLGED